MICHSQSFQSYPSGELIVAMAECEMLRARGIEVYFCHYPPDVAISTTAALFINAIWDDVPAWWNSIKARGVVEAFKNQFCYLADDLVSNMKAEMDSLIEDKLISNGK